MPSHARSPSPTATVKQFSGVKRRHLERERWIRTGPSLHHCLSVELIPAFNHLANAINDASPWLSKAPSHIIEAVEKAGATLRTAFKTADDANTAGLSHWSEQLVKEAQQLPSCLSPHEIEAVSDWRASKKQRLELSGVKNPSPVGERYNHQIEAFCHLTL